MKNCFFFIKKIFLGPFFILNGSLLGLYFHQIIGPFWVFILTQLGLKTARVRFTCGPKVSETGAAGKLTNMINMTNKHDNSNAATSNDYAHSSNKSGKVIENEANF